MKFKNLIPIILVIGLIICDSNNFQVYGNQSTYGTADAGASVSTASVVGGTVGGYLVTDNELEVDVVEPQKGNGLLQAAVPAKYRNTKVSKVKDQNPYGTCWAFSTVGLAELNLMADGVKEQDLSELHLIYHNYSTVTDPLGGTAGDSNYVNSSKQSFLTLGGDYEQAIYTLLTWRGLAEESSVDYTMADAVLSNGVDPSRAYDSVAHLQNAYIVNLKENSSEVKQLIMNYGGVGSSYCEYSKYYYSANNCYYTCGKYSSSYANHAMMIVGWDDDFSKNNFTGDKKPSSNGAWLVRNSWGKDDDSHSGYFWMSYEETSISVAAYAFDVDYKGTSGYYDNNYQYDAGFNSGKMTLSNRYDVEMANVFTTSSCYDGETLKAVGAFFPQASVDYELSVYVGITNPADPSSGTLVSRQNGSTLYSGYYTVPLNTPVSLAYGQKYSVVYRLKNNTTEAKTYQFSVETSASWPGIWSSTTNANVGESFYGYVDQNGGVAWGDVSSIAKGNLRIKAYTNNNSTNIRNNSYTISYELNGGIQNPANAVSYKDGQSIVLYEPKKSGETFYGWYTDAAFTNKIDSIYGISGDIKLYACWEVKTAQEVGLNEPTISEVNFVSNYTHITWDKIENADGYYVLRKVGDGEWKQISQIRTGETTVCNDMSSLKNGNSYQYKVVAYSENEGKEITNESKSIGRVYLSAPNVKSAKKNSKTSITLKLTKNKKATGYQLQYSTSSKFTKAKKITIKSNKTTSKKITGLKKGKAYYIRVRSFKKLASGTYYGPWATFYYVNSK